LTNSYVTTKVYNKI